LEEHGNAFVAALELVGGLRYLDAAFKKLEGCMGAFGSVTDYAEDYLESTGLLDQVPKCLRCHVDVKSYARDLELSGAISSVEVGGQVYIFTN
jgi:antirestriction protein